MERFNGAKSGENGIIPVLAVLMFAIVALYIPFKIISYGFLPSDDALRHAAKAISHKDWGQILVLRPDIKIDSHIGWHTVLAFLNKLTGCSADGLVVFSVVSLFILFCAVPIFFLKYPEAWIFSLLILSLAVNGMLVRIFSGRPYIFTMSCVLVIFLLWKRVKEKSNPWLQTLILIIISALATWIHGGWYLFVLPVAGFFIAREYKAGLLIGAALIVGIICGAALTGHPVLALYENLRHALRSTVGYPSPIMLVNEFRPFDGDVLVVIAVLLLLLWRLVRKTWDIKIVDNPIFILAFLGWLMGFKVWRFWTDLGIPAIAVWMALELQELLSRNLSLYSWKRVLMVFISGMTLIMIITSNYNGRWTKNLTIQFLSMGNTNNGKWLPEPGGIIYSNDMTVFYQTFYNNPHGNWRYILGFEQSMMRPEDLAILNSIDWNGGAYEAFGPWVKRMKRPDRLILRGPAGPPQITGLEWYHATHDLWIGRLPREGK